MAQDPNDKKPGDKRSPFGNANFIDREFAQNVRESAQQIWLAGLGAFAKAQAEGSKMFDTLVKDGVNLQKKTQETTNEKAAEAGNKWSEFAADFQAKAGQQWDKFEGLLEERTVKALKRAGVPTAKEFDALSARVDALAEQVAKRASPVRKTATAAAKKTAAKKTSLKKAPAKKASAKKTAAAKD